MKEDLDVIFALFKTTANHTHLPLVYNDCFPSRQKWYSTNWLSTELEIVSSSIRLFKFY